MTAAIESMAYIHREERDIPWHRLGTAVPEGAASAEEILHAADLDWTVGKEPLYYNLNGEMVQLENHVAIKRTMDDRIFGVTTQAYEPIQNREVFESVSEWLQDGRLQFETAGALFDGSRIWGLARVDEDFMLAGTDRITPYVLVTNGHDGYTSVVIKMVTTRVVCANTLAVAMGENRSEYKIRHTANARDRIRQASAALGLVSKRQHELMQRLEQLAQEKAVREDFEKVVDIVHPMPEGEAATERIVSRVEVDRQRLWNVFNTSDTVDQSTKYGLFNAVTEYVDHYQMRRGANMKSSNGNWLERRALFTLEGEGADERQRVFDFLTA